MDPLPILRDLVAIPSVNPMGRNISGPEYFETRLSDWLVRFFESLDVPFERMEVSPGRANIVARLERRAARETILLDAHQDTVPVDGMTIPPFEPVIQDGRLYGRGACDVKGGLAAMLAAFARLARERPKTAAASVIMVCTCDEEFGASGARAMARTWQTAPDVCVVAEPTELNIVVAHRGAVRWKLRTTGRACHSSRPQDGVNAIYKMAQVLSCLERYAEELPRMVPVHPLCGPATFSVGTIAGGISINTVPDECVIEIDRRVVPGEDPQTIVPHVATYLHERLDVDFEMLVSTVDGATLSDRNNGAWAERLMQSISQVVGERAKLGAVYGTNASRYSAAGAPALVFGPGSIAQAHTRDESIDIEQLRQAAEIYYRFCAAAG